MIFAYLALAVLAFSWCFARNHEHDVDTFFFAVGVGILWPLSFAWDCYRVFVRGE